MDGKKIRLIPIEEEYEPEIEVNLIPCAVVIGVICAALAAAALVWRRRSR